MVVGVVSRHINTIGSRQKYWLYFVEAAEVSRIKIGLTGNLDARIQAIRTSSPVKVSLLHSLRGTARQERALHCRFIESQDHCDWFNATDDLRSLIETLKHSSRSEISSLFRRMKAHPLKRPQIAAWRKLEVAS